MDLNNQPFLNNVPTDDILAIIQAHVGEVLLKHFSWSNSEYTRMKVHIEIAAFLNDIMLRRGIKSCTVQCDDRNNGYEEICSKKLVVDISIVANNDDPIAWKSIGVDVDDHSFDHHMDDKTLHARNFARAMDGV